MILSSILVQFIHIYLKLFSSLFFSIMRRRRFWNH